MGCVALRVTSLMAALMLIAVTLSLSSAHAGNRTAEDYFLEGQKYHAEKKYPEAIVVYTKAIEMRPKFIEAYYGRGSSYALADHAEHALADFNTIIAINPSEEQAYYNKGVLFQIFKKFEESIEQFDLFLKHATFQTHPDQIKDVKKLIKKLERKIKERDASAEKTEIKKDSEGSEQ